jgi:hypothetical protein
VWHGVSATARGRIYSRGGAGEVGPGMAGARWCPCKKYFTGRRGAREETTEAGR